MMLIIMRDLKSFDDAAQELFSPDPGDGNVGAQLRCNRATHPVRNASVRK